MCIRDSNESTRTKGSHFMKTNTLLTTAALAGMMFLGQGAMAQQSATERNSSDASASSSQSQTNDQNQKQQQTRSPSDTDSDSASPAGARAEQGSRGQSSKNMDQK